VNEDVTFLSHPIYTITGLLLQRRVPTRMHRKKHQL